VREAARLLARVGPSGAGHGVARGMGQMHASSGGRSVGWVQMMDL
jgi:hypothetical protein